VAGGAAAATSAESKFCLNCGKSIPKISKFCPNCGQAQP
jgi:predicted amidophosphoribosyltransferase